MSTTALKRPIGVYILAILFLVAPLGNILISFAGSGVQNWYEPNVLTSFLKSIPFIDWAWLTLLFLTGILLFRPHRLSWSTAIVTLLIVLSINAYRVYHVDANSIDPGFLKVFSVLAILCTLGVLVIAFYFRFPYLDRRANWVRNVQRFNIRTQVFCNGEKATTESISETGCRVAFDQPNTFENGITVKLQFPEISKEVTEVVIIEKLEFGFRGEYKNPSASFKQDLGRWLKDH